MPVAFRMRLASAGADADNSPDLVPARRMQLTLRGSVAEKWTGAD